MKHHDLKPASSKNGELINDFIDRIYSIYCSNNAHLAEKHLLSQTEIRFLILFEQDRYLTATGISTHLKIVKSRVTKIIEQLVQKKLLMKVDDPADSRVILLTLTPKGRAVGSDIQQALESITNAIWHNISPDRREHVMADLAALVYAAKSSIMKIH